MPIGIQPGHEQSLAGGGLSHWVVKYVAPPLSTHVVSTPEHVVQNLIIADRLATVELSDFERLATIPFCGSCPSTVWLPTIRCVPPLPFLPTSAAYSTACGAGLFRPATNHGVRCVSRITVPCPGAFSAGCSRKALKQRKQCLFPTALNPSKLFPHP